MSPELRSIVTHDGQTTLPREVRDALHLKDGDQLWYTVQDGRVTIESRDRHPGAASLGGSLKSAKGANLSFAEIRQAAADDAVEAIREKYG